MLGAFAEMGVDLVLCGHDHQEAVHYIEHTKKGTVISTAGTVSNRSRGGRPSSVNSITHHAGDRSRCRRSSGTPPRAASSRDRSSASSVDASLPRPATIRRSSTLALDVAAPRDADELLARLRALGLARIARCRLTRNRNVMVSFGGGELRVHEGYLGAPRAVLRAIVTFVEGRTRAERRAAQRVIVAHPIRVAAPAGAPRAHARRTTPSRRRSSPSGTAGTTRGTFDGRLRPVPIRVSRRMKSRLGHYTARTAGGEPAEIAISRAPSAPARLGGGAAHAAARDGAPVAGRDGPPDRPRPRRSARRRARSGSRRTRAACSATRPGPRRKARRRLGRRAARAMAD